MPLLSPACMYRMKCAVLVRISVLRPITCLPPLGLAAGLRTVSVRASHLPALGGVHRPGGVHRAQRPEQKLQRRASAEPVR